MDIAILIRTLGKGGAEKQSILLAQILSKNYGVTIYVQHLSESNKSNLDKLSTQNLELVLLPGNLFKKINSLRRQLKKRNTKVLFSYLTSDNFIAAVCKLFNKKLIAVGGIRSAELPLNKYLVNKYLHKYFLDYSIFNNYAGMKSFIEDGYIKKKCFTIHNSIGEKEERIIRKEKSNITILTVGRFIDQKDYFTALRCFKILSETSGNENINYLIIGYGVHEKKIREFIVQEKIKNVDIVISPRNIEEYYKQSDIFLCTSIFEGLPNTIMEALNSSLPVVSTNVGDVAELVKDGENGFLAKKYDVEDLALKLDILIKDHAKRIEFGDFGYNLIHDKFSQANFERKYLQFLDKITANI